MIPIEGGPAEDRVMATPVELRYHAIRLQQDRAAGLHEASIQLLWRRLVEPALPRLDRE